MELFLHRVTKLRSICVSIDLAPRNILQLFSTESICKMLHYSVVIPAKNEAIGIGDVIRKIANLDGLEEVIVVNDGSADDTAAVAEDAGAKVISHPYSKGNGAAIKTGAKIAKSEIIVFMDGDGQH